MTEFTFRFRPTAANNKPQNVIVTGTFDDWSKSIQMDPSVTDNNTGSASAAVEFTKTISIPFPCGKSISANDCSSGKILFKFVVDGQWVLLDDSVAKEFGYGVEQSRDGFVNHSAVVVAQFVQSSNNSLTSIDGKDVPVNLQVQGQASAESGAAVASVVESANVKPRKQRKSFRCDIL